MLLLAALLTSRARAAPAPAEASLTFYENRGQWPAAVRFRADLPGGALFLEPTGFLYSLLDSAALPRHGAPVLAGPPGRGHAYAVRFDGAQAGAAPQGADQLPGRRSYYLGADAARWATGVAGFRGVRYAGLYPGIDATVHESAAHRLEYDFEVAPGARPEAIALRYEGTDGLTLDAAGNLRIATGVGPVTELAPRAWQTTAAGYRQPVTCAFVLRDNRVRFQLGPYDAARPLTIDPEVLFNTFSGATTVNYGLSATSDPQGNIYSAGCLFDTGFYPTTPGAYTLATRTAQPDVVVSKFAAQGQGPAALLYSAIIGGLGTDAPHRIVINSQNELLVMGTTSSSDFPTTTGALQRNFAGGSFAAAGAIAYPTGSDLFVLKLGSIGELGASTYLGGAGNDGLLDIPSPTTLTHNHGDALRGDLLADAAGNIFVATYTASPDFPRGSGTLLYHGGAHDAAVCRLAPNLSSLAWTALLGGGGDDAAYSLALAPDGTLYAAGGTQNSGTFPATAGGYLSAPPSVLTGTADGFVTRLSPAGAVLQSTYLGTSAYDQAFFVDLDDSGSVYVLGQTLGTYPATPGAYANPRGSQFIQQLTPTLTGGGVAAVFGSGRVGITDISPTAFGVDGCGRLYVAGWGGDVGLNRSGTATFSLLAGMPVTADALRTTTDGYDLYFLRLSAGATQLEYATYYGGAQPAGLPFDEHSDGGASRFDRAGRLYYTCCTSCGTNRFPVVGGAGYYLTASAGRGSCNQTTLKLELGNGSAGTAGTPIAVCDTGAPLPLTTGQPVGGTWSGPGVTGSAATGFIFTPTAGLVGTQYLQYTPPLPGPASCRLLPTPRTVTVLGTGPVRLGPVPARLCSGPGQAPFTLTGTPAGGVFSGPGVAGNQLLPATLSAGTYTVSYSVPLTSCGGGTASASVQVLAQASLPQPGPDTTVCAGLRQPFALHGSPAGGTWAGAGVAGSAATGFVFTPPAAAGAVPLVYSVLGANCLASAIRLVTVVAGLAPAAQLAPALCPLLGAGGLGGLAPFAAQFINPVLNNGEANVSYGWDFGDGQTGAERAPTHVYTRPGFYTVRLTVTVANGRCPNTATVATVTVIDPKVPNIITPDGDGQNDVFVQRFTCLPAQLTVYSRWGQPVFRAENYANDWGAGGLPAGLYYVLLRDAAGQRYKGWLEVLK